MFLWRLAKHSLPTEDVRQNRNMSPTNSCGLCGAEDSWRHSLLECSMARCVWALVDGELAEHLCETSEPSAKQWIFAMIDSLSHEAFVRFAVTLWAIWWARRQAIHEQNFQSPGATHQFILRFIQDLELLPKETTGRNRSVPQASVRPKAPPAGFAKLHVDAAVSRSRQRSSAAAVCRDATGVYMGSSALTVQGITDAATLEAMACREALALAQDMMLHNIVVASDSKMIVADIHRASNASYSSIINEIRERSEAFNCNFIYEGRAANVDADRLAKYSHSLDLGRHLWLMQPHDPFCIPHHVVFE